MLHVIFENPLDNQLAYPEIGFRIIRDKTMQIDVRSLPELTRFSF